MTMYRAPPSIIPITTLPSFIPQLIFPKKKKKKKKKPKKMPSRPISATQKPDPNTRSRVILLSLTITATVIFVLTLIYIFYYLWDSLFRRSRTNPFDSISPTLKLQRLSYKELKSATNNFNVENSIGKGGSGAVFRGILKDGKSVAVKKLDAGSSLQAEKEFQSELTILGSIKSSYIVSLLGYCIEKNKRVLVYEYMPNHSLQERLFSTSGLYCMNWERRFEVVQDVAKALEFLHNECDPPVIHGDVKPSNVLLDWEFKGKLSDFGLSRVKVEDEVGVVDMFSQDLGRSQELSGNLNGDGLNHIEGQFSGGGGEVDFALALQASSSSKNSRGLQKMGSLNHDTRGVQASPKGKEVLVEEHVVGLIDQEVVSSVEHSKELELNGLDDVGCVKQWGKDWWWKQDDSGELSSKEYVNEWIGTQVDHASTTRDWENLENLSSPMATSNLDQLDGSPHLDKSKKEKEAPVLEFQLGCLGEKGVDKKGKEKTVRKSKPRKMQDWWKEEQIDEMNNKKGSKRKTLRSKMKKPIKLPNLGLSRRFYILKRRFKDHNNHMDDSLNHHDFGFKRDWRRKNARSMGSEMSGDLYSRELSSTTSMRGTLCYVAPEYGGCGCLMEKGDIYSLGVLMLVIVSGRRPLHVLNSPMKLEKANLVSWCRHLALSGNVLELVDERLKEEYDKEQVTLCIHLALACLQRVPELRPDIGDIVRILRGEMELPPLPFEFSPSPPPKFYSKSRRKDGE
ncbi:hypothetical protein RND81_10G197900 [Saponaria officinalis]